MRFFTFFIATLWTLSTLGFAATQVEIAPPLPSIKVLIGETEEGSLIEVKGAYKVSDPLNHSQLTSTFGSKRYFLQPMEKGIQWGKYFKNTYQIRIEPKDPTVTLLVNGTEYSGAIEAYWVEDKIYLINETDIETYIKSRMTNEFSRQSAHESALEAIAIVERTKAYYEARAHGQSIWHVDGRKSPYKGLVTTKLSPDIDAAVDLTQAMVMTYKGHPFPAELTGNCAGMTADYPSIFRKNVPCPHGVESPIARKDRQLHSWRFKVHRDQLAQMLKMDKISNIDLFVDQRSGRAYAMRIESPKGHRDIKYESLAEKIGPDQLKSNDYTITMEPDFILFEGYGEGSGTGLCLYSAHQMAKQGDSVEQILADFFPHAHINEMNTLVGKQVMPPLESASQLQ